MHLLPPAGPDNGVRLFICKQLLAAKLASVLVSEGSTWLMCRAATGCWTPLMGHVAFVGLRQYAVCLGLLDKGKVSTSTLMACVHSCLLLSQKVRCVTPISGFAHAHTRRAPEMVHAQWVKPLCPDATPGQIRLQASLTRCTCCFKLAPNQPQPSCSLCDSSR